MNRIEFGFKSKDYKYGRGNADIIMIGKFRFQFCTVHFLWIVMSFTNISKSLITKIYKANFRSSIYVDICPCTYVVKLWTFLDYWVSVPPNKRFHKTQW